MEEERASVSMEERISHKLDKFMDDVKVLLHQMIETNNYFRSAIKQEISSGIQDSMKKFITEIKGDFQSIKHDVKQSMKPNLIKDLDWNKRLTRRKFLYYESYRCNSIADSYETALHEDTPKVPRKYFKNPKINGDVMDIELVQKLTIKEVENEIERLRITAKVKMDFVHKIDNEIMQLCNDSFDDEEAKMQISKWRFCTDNEEANSHKIWEEKSEFFSSNKHLISLTSISKFQGNKEFRNNRRPTYAEVTRYDPRNRYIDNNRFRPQSSFQPRNIRPYYNNPRRNFDRNNRYRYRNYNRNNENTKYNDDLYISFNDQTNTQLSNNTNNDYFLG